jgi:PAS domain S-box-containing protein
MDSGSLYAKPQNKNERYSHRMSDTAAKGRHKSFREGDDFYQSVIESIEDYAVFTTDTDGTISSWNKGAERLLGFSETEVIGQNASIFFIPEDSKKNAAGLELKTAAEQGRALDERYHLRKDGSRFWACGLVFPLKDEQGGLRGFTKVMRDLTDRKRLQASEERFKTLIENGTNAIALLDMQGVCLYVTPVVERILGYTPDEFTGTNAFTYALPEELELLQHKFQDVIASPGKTITIEHRYKHKDGSVKWLESTVTNLLSKPNIEAIVSNFRDITDEKQHESALEGALDQLRLATEAGKIGTWDWDIRHNTIHRSDQYYKILGIKPDQINDSVKGYLQFIHPDDRDRAYRQVQTALEKRRGFEVDYRIVRPDGSVRWVTDKGRIYRDKAGKAIRASGSCIDITNRKQAEERLRESEEQFRLLVQGVKDYAILRLDTEGYITSWNKGATRIKGYEATEAIGKHFSMFYIPEDREVNKPVKLLNMARRDGSSQDEGWRLRKDGTAFWASVTITAIRDSSGKLLGYTKVTRDMTERMQYEESLKYQTSLLETMTNNATLALLMMDDRQHCTFMNPAAERMTGYTLDEVQGAPLHEFVHHTRTDGSPYPLEECPIDRALPQNNREQGEETFVHKDGTFYPVSFTASPIVDNGKPVGTIIEARDLTEEKKTQAALAESEERFRTLAEAIPQLVWVAGTDGANEYLNHHWYEFTGQSVDEAAGWGWAEVLHPKDLPAVQKEWKKAVKSGEDFSAEYRIRAKNGDYRWFLGQGSPLRDQKGGVVKWFGASTDIEDLKRRRELEEMTVALTEQRQQLMALNKAKDDFISLASHQLRTPATGVKQYVGMLLEGYVGDLSKEQKDMLRFAYQSNERQLNIVDDLLKVAHIDAGQVTLFKEKTDIVQLLHDVLREQHSKFKSRNQTVAYDRPKHKVMAVVDRSRLRMVLENLVDNASKYTPEGKKITVKISEQPKRKRVVIAVKDEGVGIAEKDFDRLFQKFSRLDNVLSQAVGGSGLGLYWVKKVVDLHEGTIKVKSAVNKGTAFTIHLPTLL